MKHKNFVTLLCLLTTLAMTLPASADIAEHVTRTRAGGVDLLTYPMGVKDVVTLSGSLPAGDVDARDGNIAAAAVVGMMLSRGTTKQDKLAIASALDDAGVQLQFTVGPQTLSISGLFLKKDVALVTRILAEQLRMPAFTSDELEKAKTQFTATIRQRQQSTSVRATQAFANAVYSKTHPNYLPDAEALIAAAQKLTVADLKAFHQKHYGPANLTLIFTGDVEAKKIQREVGKVFSGWRGGVEVDRKVQATVPPPTGDVVVRMADKSSVSVVIGQPTGLRYADPDAMALRVGTAILGSGFTGRLMKALRDEQGLTYGVSAGMQDDTFVDGAWFISSDFAPTLLDKGVASARAELQKWWQGGVTAEELTARKTNLVGSYQVSLATTGGMAQAIRSTIERGKPLSWLDDYPKAVNALTVQQVNDAIKKYLDPNKAVLVEAGTFGGGNVPSP